MHAIKTPSFLRPSSTPPAAPAAPSPSDSGIGPESSIPLNRLPSRGPLTRLALTSRKRPPAPTTPPATPTLAQDGTYLEALSLKLSEGVSKALSQPAGESALNGKRTLPRGRGSALGALIASELDASVSNSYLHRAIIRSLHRPLSVLLSNLSAQLLPLTSSSQFAAHPTPSVPSPAQLNAVAYATFAAELLQVFDMHELGKTETHGSGMATDNLRGIREGFESLIARVLNPLTQGVKKEIIPLIDALEYTSLPSPTSPTSTKQGPTPGRLVNVSLHPSIIVLQNLIPLHAQNWAKYIMPPTVTSQTTLAALLISLIWHSLVALSRRAPAPSSPSPPQIPAPPQRTPPSMRLTIKLPPPPPASPPDPQPPSPSGDARALCELFGRLPRPDPHERFAVAREAVDEAFSGLAALAALLDAEAAGGHVTHVDLDALTADLPTVIALPVLLRMFGGDEGGRRGVAALLGLREEEYRASCLAGFGRARECGPPVARRVVDALAERRDARWDALIRWLEERVNSTE